MVIWEGHLTSRETVRAVTWLLSAVWHLMPAPTVPTELAVDVAADVGKQGLLLLGAHGGKRSQEIRVVSDRGLLPVRQAPTACACQPCHVPAIHHHVHLPQLHRADPSLRVLHLSLIHI